MKENDGKGARRKLIRQIGLVLAIFAVLIGIATLTGLGGTGNGNDGGGSNRGRKLKQKMANYLDGNGSGGRIGKRGSLLEKAMELKQGTTKRLKRHIAMGEQEGGDDEEIEDLLSSHQRIPKEVVLERILNAELHLVDLEVNEEEVLESSSDSYSGVYGIFCALDFSIHKRDPSSVPMFRDLVNHSGDCDLHKFRFELSEIARLARERDAQVLKEQGPTGVPKALNLTAVVFHESRCGSTLVANTLIGMDPKKHRTYSESSPPAVAIKGVCGETYSLCSKQQAAMVLRDTMYIMSRTNDPNEERVFFKMQSITTRSIPTFLEAYPLVPWLFVFRDPVQVMMSHFKDGIHHANCVRSKQRPPPIVQAILKRRGMSADNRLQDEYFCAAHLASITESAVHAMTRISDLGIPVLYDSLPERLYDDVLPSIFGREMTVEEISNIDAVSQKYAKGRGNRARTFTGDSEQKEQAASDAVKHAAELFLKESFKSLSRFAKSMPAD